MKKRGNGTGFLIKGKQCCRASYTVEASYIMAIVLASLAILIQTAFDRYRQETGIMRLHHVVEQMRGQMTETERELTDTAWQGSVQMKDNKIWSLDNLPWEGPEVKGSVEGNGWQKEISAHVHSPEDMMRMMALADLLEKISEGEEEDGGTEKSGDQLP